MVGTFVSILIIFTLFSLLSRFLNRSGKVKMKFQPSILPDADGNKECLPKKAPIILQINIDGVIGADDLSLAEVESQLIESQIGAFSNNRVRGILLKVNSPGGSAVDSDGIYRKLKAYKEKYQIPIYAYVEGYCASGGMFIVCAADKVLSAPSSVIGSIGVRCAFPFLNVHKLLERWEIGSKTIAIGKHKDHLNPFRPWEEGEDSDLQNLLLQSYNRFVDVVALERKKLTRELLVEEYGAQIYSAPDAAKLGFIDDGASEYEKALRELAQASKIGKEETYQVVELVKKKSPLQELFRTSPLLSGRIKHEIQIGSFNTSPIKGIAYLPLDPYF